MSDDAVRQRYRVGTGRGLQGGDPPRTPGKPGFRSGGTVKKQAGGAMYRKGGSTKKR